MLFVSGLGEAAFLHVCGDGKVARVATWTPKVCSKIAFYRLWAMISPTLRGLGGLGNKLRTLIPESPNPCTLHPSPRTQDKLTKASCTVDDIYPALP